MHTSRNASAFNLPPADTMPNQCACSGAILALRVPILGPVNSWFLTGRSCSYPCCRVSSSPMMASTFSAAPADSFSSMLRKQRDVGSSTDDGASSRKNSNRATIG